MEQLNVALGHAFKVIDAECIVGDGHLYPTRVGQFLTVDFSAQPVFQASLQDAVGFLGREEALVAKHVDEVGQALASHFGQHLVDNVVNVVALATCKGATHGVRPEKRRDDLQRSRLLDAPDDAQHFQLVSGSKSVAALDFDGSRTLSDDFADALHGLFVEFVFAGVVQSVGRVQDASAAPRNLFVAQTANLIDKLALATAGIDNVGVAVAKRREHESALSIDSIAIDRRNIIHRSEILDSPVFHEKPGVVNRVQLAHFASGEKWLLVVSDTNERPYIDNNFGHNSIGVTGVTRSYRSYKEFRSSGVSDNTFNHQPSTFILLKN